MFCFDLLAYSCTVTANGPACFGGAVRADCMRNVCGLYADRRAIPWGIPLCLRGSDSPRDSAYNNEQNTCYLCAELPRPTRPPRLLRRFCIQNLKKHLLFVCGCELPKGAELCTLGSRPRGCHRPSLDICCHRSCFALGVMKYTHFDPPQPTGSAAWNFIFCYTSKGIINICPLWERLLAAPWRPPRRDLAVAIQLP